MYRSNHTAEQTQSSLRNITNADRKIRKTQTELYINCSSIKDQLCAKIYQVLLKILIKYHIFQIKHLGIPLKLLQYTSYLVCMKPVLFILKLLFNNQKKF